MKLLLNKVLTLILVKRYTDFQRHKIMVADAFAPETSHVHQVTTIKQTMRKNQGVSVVAL